MSPTTLDELLALPMEQKIDLIDKLWRSVGDADAALSAAQRAELERRLADHEAHPEDTFSVDEVLEGLS